MPLIVYYTMKRIDYALAVSDLKKTKPKPANNIKWNGNKPKSFNGTALYIPNKKQINSENYKIMFGDNFLEKYLLP